MKKSLKKPLVAAVQAGILLSTGLSTAIQYAHAEEPRAKRSAFLEEIIVTSRKRSVEENVQDIPAALSAFSEDMLDAAFVDTITDIGKMTPNVTLQNTGVAPGVPSYFIRGQGSSSSIPSDDPPVATIFDGVTFGTGNGSNMTTFDIESIEVLRGPQGTLFGKNTTGGAVVIRTARAGFETLADVKITAGSGNLVDLAARVGGTIIEDRVAGKLSVFYMDRDGNYDNVFLNQDFGAAENTVIRPYLRVTPSDELTLDLLIESGDINSHANPFKQIVPDVRVDPTDTDVERSGDPDKVALTTNGDNDMEWDHAILEAVYDTDNGVFTSITAVRQAHQILKDLDADGRGNDIFRLDFDTDQEQFSQEVRWAGTPFSNKDIDITVGAYYFSQEYVYRERRALSGGLLNVALGGDIEHDVWAVFARGNWKVTDQVTASAGLRFTDETKKGKVQNGATCDFDTQSCDFATPPPDAMGPFAATDDLEVDSSSVTPYLGIQWFPTEDAQIYASWSKGFRSGGLNVRTSTPTRDEPLYDDEEVNAFEVGGKFEMADGRVRLNTAAFLNRYDDMQRTVVIFDGSQQVRNAASADMYGLEIDLTASLTDNFTAIVAYGWLDGGYDEFNGIALPPGLDVASLEIDKLSNNSVSVAGIYDLDLGDNGAVTLRASYYHLDERAGDDTNTAFLDQLDMFDLSATWTSPSEKLRVSAFGKNLTNTNEETSAAVISLFDVRTPAKPRHYGIEVQYSFF